MDGVINPFTFSLHLLLHFTRYLMRSLHLQPHQSGTNPCAFAAILPFPWRIPWRDLHTLPFSRSSRTARIILTPGPFGRRVAEQLPRSTHCVGKCWVSF